MSETVVSPTNVPASDFLDAPAHDRLARRHAGHDLTTDRPSLLVASTGGHLAQLHRLHTRLGIGSEAVWATFDTPQSRSLLSGRDVEFVRFTDSRDYRNVARNLARAVAIIRRVQPSCVVSTGSAIALSFLPAARLLNVPVAYIESAARSAGPSLSGRIVSRIPGIELYTQYPEWADERWQYLGSVFDHYAALPDPIALSSPRPLRVLVSLGTIRYPFRRLVERMREILPADAEVLWQTGATDVSDLGLENAHRVLPASEMAQAMRDADIVVAHSGVGSALEALDAGRVPVLVPRTPAHGEHVDAHQLQVGEELDRRGLAILRSVEELDMSALLGAARGTVLKVAAPPPMQLRVVTKTRPARNPRVVPVQQH